jgi:uncharacterized coiled-coil DUF342 family protein
MNTPETDNLARGNHVVPTEWAEQLERERDEERKIAEKLRKERFEARKFALALHEEHVKLKTERDEWSKLCGQYKQERDEAIRHLENHTASTIHSCHNQCQRPMCVLRRERDEARDLSAALLLKANILTAQ